MTATIMEYMCAYIPGILLSCILKDRTVGQRRVNSAVLVNKQQSIFQPMQCTTHCIKSHFLLQETLRKLFQHLKMLFNQVSLQSSFLR